MFNEPDLELELSEFSQKISNSGKTIEVEIYRFVGENSWTLEVVDQYGNSTVWDDDFALDIDALNEVKRVIFVDGIDTLIGSPCQ